MAETKDTDIDPARISKISNAEVRKEFVHKVGLSRIYYKLGGVVLDQKVVSLTTPENQKWLCNYKLVRLKYGVNSIRHVLEMPNASLPDIIHVEYVPTKCQTVEQAMNFRLNRKEEDIDENGSDFYIHGDRVLVPDGATKTKRWPKIIA